MNTAIDIPSPAIPVAEQTSKTKPWWKRRVYVISVCATVASLIALFFGVEHFVSVSGHSYQVTPANAPEADAAIVLGAAVFPDGTPSEILRDRIDRAIQLYRAKKVKKLLMTGDHGEASYDEVNGMARYAIAHGIPQEDIFLDHAGFNTCESMYRARDVFQVKRAIVVTQQFHLSRSVYIARALGIEAWGVSSDLHRYGEEGYLETKELPARFKAFVQVNILHSRPTYLGPAIPITGDGRRTSGSATLTRVSV